MTRIEPFRLHNVRVEQIADRRALLLEIAEIVGVGRKFEGDEMRLVLLPQVVVRPPDLAERAASDAQVEDVFVDSQTRGDIGHEEDFRNPKPENG